MHGLWLRSLIYLAGVGGVWLILLPSGLLYVDPAVSGIHLRTWPFLVIGVPALALGVMLALRAGAHLIHEGQGTPFPLDPTRHLVTTGLYGTIRNPQAVALVLLTSAEALVVDSALVWILPAVTVLFLLGIAEPFEDWELQRRFGQAYDTYRTNVPRWFPKRMTIRHKKHG